MEPKDIETEVVETEDIYLPPPEIPRLAFMPEPEQKSQSSSSEPSTERSLVSRPSYTRYYMYMYIDAYIYRLIRLY